MRLKILILPISCFLRHIKTLLREYGFGIENIGFGNIRMLRIDFNWRGNYLENPGAQKFGIKFGLQYNY